MEINWNEEVAHARAARQERAKLGRGLSPAVIVVDFQRAFTEHAGVRPSMRQALENTARLLASARDHGVPVIYLAVVLDSLDQRPLSWRIRPGLTVRCLRDDPMVAIDDQVAMQPKDILVEKRVASGFFETRLDEVLKSLAVDEIILAGTSTSGCVRATVLDAHYRDYLVTVVEDCVDDFRPLSGEASLVDIQDRYGDIASLDEMLASFDELRRASTGAEASRETERG